MKLNTETKVGVLFFAGLALLLWFVIFVNANANGDGEYSVRFKRVVNLKAGDAVTYNGVKVGTVARVIPVLDTGGGSAIEVGFDIEHDLSNAILIDGDTRIIIDRGLFGASRLAIITPNGGDPIQPSLVAALRGETPPDLDAAIKQLAAMVEENREPLREAIAKLPEAIDNLAGMGGEIEGMVADNRKVVGEAVTGMRDMTASVRELVDNNRENLTKAVDRFAALVDQAAAMVDENRGDIRSAIERLPTAVDEFATLGTQLRGLVEDNRAKLDTIIDNLAKAAPRIDRIAADVEVVTAQIASGQGTIGKVVFDDRLATSAQRAVESIERRAEEVEPLTSSFANLKLYGGVGGGYASRSEVLTGNAYIRIEPDAWKYYEAGLTWKGLPRWADEEPDFVGLFLQDSLLVGSDFAYARYLYERDVYLDDQDDDEATVNNLAPHLLIGFRFIPVHSIERYRLDLSGGLIEGQLGGRIGLGISEDFGLWTTARLADDSRLANGQEREKGPVQGRAWLTWNPWSRIDLHLGVDDLYYKPGPYVGISGEILDQDLTNLFTAAGLF